MPEILTESPVSATEGGNPCPDTPLTLPELLEGRIERLEEENADLRDQLAVLQHYIERLELHARVMHYREATARIGEDLSQVYTLEELCTKYGRTRQTLWNWQQEWLFPAPAAKGVWRKEEVDAWDETYGTEEGRRVLSLILRLKRAGKLR